MATNMPVSGETRLCPADRAGVGGRRSWKRWFQFSLRGLLIFTTLVAVGLAWFVSRYERQRRAVTAIEALGGKVGYAVTKTPPGFLEQWLRRHLPRNYLDDVVLVEWSGRKATDDDLVHLAGLASLKKLYLGYSQVTDAGLVQLAKLPSLETLDLSNTQVTDAGLVHLTRLTSLELLNLGSTQVSDAGLADLAKLTSLKRLYLWNTQVTDNGLVHLAGLTSLEELGLGRTQVTDAGLVHVAGLTSLEWLHLTGAQVTDAGLVHLAGLPSLQRLYLRDTQVTGAGVAELKKTLPKVDAHQGSLRLPMLRKVESRDGESSQPGCEK